jgi:hypothetical protein
MFRRFSKKVSWVVCALISSFPVTASELSSDHVNGVVRIGKGFQILTKSLSDQVCVVSNEDPIEEDDNNDFYNDPFDSYTSRRRTTTRRFPSRNNQDTKERDSIDDDNSDLFDDDDFADDEDTDTTTKKRKLGEDKNDDGESVESFDAWWRGIGALPAPKADLHQELAWQPTQLSVDYRSNRQLFADDGAQTGGVNVEYGFYHSVRELSRAIQLGASGSQGIGDGEEGAGYLAKFIASLDLKFSGRRDVTFILFHGRKTYPLEQRDTVISPMFNPKLVPLVFGGEEAPATDEERAAAYEKFRGVCGDQYVEYVSRGREIFLVAAMATKSFELTFNSKASMSGQVSTGDVAGVKKSLKGKASADTVDNFLNERVEILVKARGHNDFAPGDMTLGDALGRLDQFLEDQNRRRNEAILGLGLRGFDSVQFELGEKAMRGADVFPKKLRETYAKGAEAVQRLAVEKQWAEREAQFIWKHYGWEQFDFTLTDSSIGVGHQYVSLVNYARKIKLVFDFCGSKNLAPEELTEECEKRVLAALKTARPKVDLPEPLEHQINLVIPARTKGAMDKPVAEHYNHGLSFAAAEKECKKIGMTLPDLKAWQQLTHAARNYQTWKISAQPNYDGRTDTHPLGQLIDGYRNSYFWSNRDGNVLGIDHLGRVVGNSLRPVPKAYKSYWSNIFVPYVCVSYKSSLE